MALSVGIPHLERLTGKGSRSDHGAGVVRSERCFELRRPAESSSQKLIDQRPEADISRRIRDDRRIGAQAVIPRGIGIVAESEQRQEKDGDHHESGASRW
jgi:hypothetical protein